MVHKEDVRKQARRAGRSDLQFEGHRDHGNLRSAISTTWDSALGNYRTSAGGETEPVATHLCPLPPRCLLELSWPASLVFFFIAGFTLNIYALRTFGDNVPAQFSGAQGTQTIPSAILQDVVQHSRLLFFHLARPLPFLLV